MPFTLRGRVISGFGEGRRYIALPVYNILMTEILGSRPFLGTLNIEVKICFKDIITSCTPLQIKSVVINRQEYGGFYYWLGKIKKEGSDKWFKCLLLRPHKSRHPDNVIEAVAEHNLREALNLRDGDLVEVFLMCGEDSWF